MPVTQITSDNLIEIEKHFRVSAGPGAGKTYWLVKHIKNVLHNSERLGKTRKIACITYTNVAVETILGRLGTASERVEVSTIHSFLYKNIIKPYILFIAEEYNFNVQKMDGHDDHYVSFSKVRNWIENHPNVARLRHPYTVNQLCRLENNKKAVINWLSTIKYSFNALNLLEFDSDRSEAFYLIQNGGKWERRNLSNACLDILETGFLSYKKLYWSEGTLHHDDVLFFSYELIKKFPFILKVLRAKFPYFFVDEFQDTNPIQTAILEQIGQEETIVGIIGDKAQSIYGFQGAKPEHFETFALSEIKDFQMVDNRRSTNQNIDLLDCIRKDISQNKIRNENGDKPRIIVGEMDVALKKCQDLCGDEKVYSLSRLNITSNAMKREVNGIAFDSELANQLLDRDRSSNTNGYRSKVIVSCIKVSELAHEKKFKEAIRELEKIFRNVSDKIERRKITLKHIHLLLQKRAEFESKSLYDFHSFIKNEIKPEISNLAAGGIKDFYDAYNYQQLALCISISEDDSLHRTIHKAKGAEFDNVLLVMRIESNLEFLLNPNLTKERHRVYYVAVSRARNRLFINIPALSEENKTKLESLNFDIL